MLKDRVFESEGDAGFRIGGKCIPTSSHFGFILCAIPAKAKDDEEKVFFTGYWRKKGLLCSEVE